MLGVGHGLVAMERLVGGFFEVEGCEGHGQQIDDAGGFELGLLQAVPGLAKADDNAAEVGGLDVLGEERLHRWYRRRCDRDRSNC